MILISYVRRYFQSLSKGEVPPVKSRYEMDTTGDGGLSKGRLSALHNQFKASKMANVDAVRESWVAIGCESMKLDEILRSAPDNNTITFLAHINRIF